jgi:acetoin utilization protein AcuB
MNTLRPVSQFMTANLETVGPETPLNEVRDLFVLHDFHHIPVVNTEQEIIGIISKSDFERFQGGAFFVAEDRFIQESRLKSTKAEHIMTKGLAKLDPADKLDIALDIFCMNRFHALPVEKNGKLIGILTPYDILKALQQEKHNHLEYQII